MRRFGVAAAAVVTVVVAVMVVAPLASGGAARAQDAPPATVRVATKPLEPFVFLDRDVPRGYSVDVWNHVAAELGVTTQWVAFDSVKEILDAVAAGEADVAIAGISMTPEREDVFDFSYPYFDAGLQVYTAPSGKRGPLAAAADLLFRRDVVVPLLALLALVVVVSHGVWWSERRHNPEFPERYGEGIREAIWWSTVNVITGGEAVKDIRRSRSRLLALMWMVVGLLVMAYVTARITSVLTVQELRSDIAGVEDLPGRDVVTVEATAAAEYLEANNLPVRALATLDLALAEVADGRADAIVFDSPVLAYRSATDYSGRLQAAGAIFEPDAYGIALPQDQDALKEGIDKVLLSMAQDGTADDLYRKWFRTN